MEPAQRLLISGAICRRGSLLVCAKDSCTEILCKGARLLPFLAQSKRWRASTAAGQAPLRQGLKCHDRQ
eukprot:1548459-Alexandrium_andersonii.AAC.1